MFHTLNTFDTEFSADSVEWCPSNLFKNTLVCGTYQLSQTDEDDSKDKTCISKRLGRIYFLRILNEGKIKLLQQIEMPAVLDTKWAHIEKHNKILLGVANSIGYLQIYQLIKDTETLELNTEIKINNDEEETLILSLDWCSGKWTSDNNSELKIVVSDSKGSISLIAVNESELKKIASWHAHDFEAWIGAFDYWDTNVIYSGGDDCKFQSFDCRIGARATMVNRIHEAGVTSIHSNAKEEFILASGSYDEKLRIWDKRNFRRPLSETNLGGGIWRLKWDPFMYKYLLAACMYGGFRIIDCNNFSVPSIVSEYKEHKSISYGCDWSYLTPEEILDQNITDKSSQNNVLVGTCSFYDHILKLSAVNFETN